MSSLHPYLPSCSPQFFIDSFTVAIFICAGFYFCNWWEENPAAESVDIPAFRREGFY
jgi:hypothetical protein